MLDKLVRYFHHVLQPHCAICREEAHCKNCDTLREILAEERFEKRRLIDRLLPNEAPTLEYKTEAKPIAVGPQFKPWRVRQAELERNERETSKENLIATEALKSQILPTNAKSTEELEEELLGEANG